MIFEQFKKNLENLIGRYKRDRIAVAVSGGSDSIALLYLLHEWAQDNNVKLLVLTVNHDLRSSAYEEVEYVKAISSKLGYECITLKWLHQNNHSNLQERAREARYDLMSEACKARNIEILCTGHHLDDALENMLLRENRKSGKLGQVASNIFLINNILIMRPLLNIKKENLVNYLLEKKISWYEDETNSTDKYQRGVVRQFIKARGEGFEKSLQDKQISLLQNSYSLQYNLIKAIAEIVQISPLGFAIIEIDKLRKNNLISENFELSLQVISYSLTIIGGKTILPRAQSVKNILTSIDLKNNFLKTLHGCCIKKSKKEIIIYREFGRNPPKEVPLRDKVIWDNRFLLSTSLENKEAVVTNLTKENFRQLKNTLPNILNVPFFPEKKILFTLPVIKVLEKVVSFPHISYYDKTVVKEIKLSFYTSFTSRFTHFS